MHAHTYSLRSALALLLIWVSAPPAFGASPASGATRDFSRDAAHTSPDWLRAGVIYEIYPRDFSATGDFKGVTAQLDRLHELGVDILWLMPIHPVGALKRKGTLGSPYAVRDYYGINPDYGTATDLHQLVSEAHQRGMRVIIDIVANHTAWDSVLMKNPAYYTHDAGGHIVSPQPDWADVADLNYENPQLRQYMLEMLQYWLREFDLDGYRCDVASGVPTPFWEQARLELKKIKPDIILLAESEEPGLLSQAFDIDYSWALYHAMNDAIQGRRPASAVQAAWRADAARYQRGALRLRFADNHDESRALARFGEPGALAATALIFTLDGVPLLYNGMEVGDSTESGAPALFEKLPVLWSIAQRRAQFPRFYRQIVAFRKAHPALSSGKLTWLHNSDENRIVTFTRQDAAETLLIAINLSSQPFIGSAEPSASGYREITPDAATAVSSASHAEALPALSLAAWEFRVFGKHR